MANHKLLYVDDMKSDKMQAFVKKRDKIIYNLEASHLPTAEMFKDAIVEFKKGTLVSIAGRYICITTMGLKEKQQGMLIVNLDNNEKGKGELINKFSNPAVTERIMTAFKAIKNTPQEYYDFELEVGEIPVS